MKKLILILLGIFLISGTVYSNAYALWRPGSFEKIVDTTELIAIGKVIDSVEASGGNFAIFKIEQVIKGDNDFKIVRIKNARNISRDDITYIEGPPEAKYKKGERCLVFLKKWKWGDYFITWYDYQGKCEIDNGYIVSHLDEGKKETILLSELVEKIENRLRSQSSLQPTIKPDETVKEVRKKAEAIAKKYLAKRGYKDIYQDSAYYMKEGIDYFEFYFHRKDEIKNKGIIRVNTKTWEAKWIPSK